MHNRHIRKLVTTLAVISLVAARGAQLHRNHQTSLRPHGAFTRRQVILRSEPLAMALSRGKAVASIVASPFDAHQGDRGLRPIWMAESNTADGTLQVYIVMDAVNGDLFSISRSTPGPLSNAPATVSYRDAVRITGSWLATLGVADKDVHWVASADPDHNNRMWRIAWTGDTHRMEIEIDAHTGELIVAQASRMRVLTTRRRLVAKR